MSTDPSGLLVTRDLLNALMEDASLPTPSEQADALVLFLGRIESGKWFKLEPSAASAITCCEHSDGVEFILDSLAAAGLIDRAGAKTLGDQSRIYGRARLSFDGWRRYAELQRGAVAQMKGFMAMSFNHDDVADAYRECFKPASGRAGFELRRLDDDPQAGLMDARMLVEVRTSAFVVADLTYGNHGAYWESGFAEGLGKPVIYTCEASYWEEQRGGTHFDTNHRQTVIWHPEDLDEAGERLTASIRATLPDLAAMEDVHGSVDS